MPRAINFITCLAKKAGQMNKKYRDILDTIASPRIPDNLNLFPRVTARINQRKSIMQTLRARPALAVILAVFALLFLTGVAYAIGRLSGYIPGVGIVDQSTPIRVLAEPLTSKQQDISITVSQVVADSTRTHISYHVDGIPMQENMLPACAIISELHLPDGTNLENTGDSSGTAGHVNGNTMSYATNNVFGPIPQDGKNATFFVSCVTPDGGSRGTWNIPLNLIPAPAGFATPAVELAVTVDADKNKTGLHLEKVLELADSYILIGKFSDGGDLGGPLNMSTSSDSEYLPHIEDANGNPVPFKVREDARPDPDWDVAYHWAYEIQKPVSTPLTITVDSVNTRKHHTALFKFDAGDHPRTSQKWELNQTVKLGESEFVIQTITFIGNGYEFKLSSKNLPEGVSPGIEFLDSSSNLFQFDSIDEKQFPAGKTMMYTITLTSSSPPPAGTMTLNWWLDEAVPQSGPWSLVWGPSKTKP
jgi:hypothetical protein